MEEVAPPLLGQPRIFRLSGRPAGSSIEVRVDGALVPPQGRWTYDASLSSVVFTPVSIPARGAEVEIAYPVECL